MISATSNSIHLSLQYCDGDRPKKPGLKRAPYILSFSVSTHLWHIHALSDKRFPDRRLMAFVSQVTRDTKTSLLTAYLTGDPLLWPDACPVSTPRWRTGASHKTDGCLIHHPCMLVPFAGGWHRKEQKVTKRTRGTAPVGPVNTLPCS